MTTKNNLINAVHNNVNYLLKEDIVCSIDLVINHLKNMLQEEKRIEVRGFGSFSIRKRKKAGSDNKLYNVVYFRMAKTIGDKLNKRQ